MYIPPEDHRLRHVCRSCHEILYENPRNIVGVLPFYNNEILLCQRAIEPRYGHWTIPAGFLEIGESLEQGALREANEEAGIRPNLINLFCIYQIPKIGQCYFIFLGELKHQQYRLGNETLDAKWVQLNQVKQLSLAFSSVQFILDAYEKWCEDPSSLKLPINYIHNS